MQNNDNIDISKHGGFLGDFIKKYEGKGIPHDDLMQAGYYGLQRATARFDKDKGFAFLTFAKFHARKHILKLLAKHIKYDNNTVSSDAIDAGREDDHLSVEETTSDGEQLDPSQVLEKADLLKCCLAALNRKELAFVYSYFWDKLDYSQIAMKHNVSKQYVCKVVNRGLEKMKAVADEKNFQMELPL